MTLETPVELAATTLRTEVLVLPSNEPPQGSDDVVYRTVLVLAPNEPPQLTSSS